ncbi:hypothetical protein U8607_05315 [Methylobacterium durans]|uniref:hypothetical protein n=1 Tax=Methylobacterium durans TaxID=2202825 RepID=UPI002AFF44F5|nr:hypothetical protein [Methylobacterium durans]MEA1831498.1 hypothetical protein [Methylobacterium durans]
MNIPAALVLQSVPFAGLALAQETRRRDEIAVVYVAVFGLLVSFILLFGDVGSLSSDFVQATQGFGY